MNFAAKKTSKTILIFVAALAFRLLPFRAPNVEPITAALMPVSKSYGKFFGIFFAVSSVLAYDMITRTLGAHTFFTAAAFVAIALWAEAYFAKKEASRMNFAVFAAMATVFFDAVTGLLPGPVFFGQPLSAAIAGQIPFTALHLVGNIAFAITLSPAINHLLSKERKRKRYPSAAASLNPKTT